MYIKENSVPIESYVLCFIFKTSYVINFLDDVDDYLKQLFLVRLCIITF